MKGYIYAFSETEMTSLLSLGYPGSFTHKGSFWYTDQALFNAWVDSLWENDDIDAYLAVSDIGFSPLYWSGERII